ncbi:phosphatase PAP2 family protein [Agromyces seonyuensis]|uniref:Phosphatase PAP2 family protein n=1 Tax=Agromyces seonyuensis TaxID=2662446 RepID=A0A6I4P6E4_9MICO|nr:phosphatase PAP2 family protein [Agromyces seonyuensis]MWB99194.1 phosphatase PAP2 family protein [Agromyces seonyuensis]
MGESTLSAGRRRATSAVAAGSLLGITLVAYWFAVLTPFGQSVDAAAFGAIAPLQLTIGGAAAVVRQVGIVVLLGMVGVLWVRAIVRRRFDAVVRAFLGLGFAAIVGSALKDLLPRPLLGDYGYLYNTFPSGHAAASAAALGCVAVLAPPGRAKAPVIAVAGFLALTVTSASLTSFAHRPSDLLGGACFGAGIVALAWFGRSTPFARAPLLGVVGALALLVALGMVVVPAFGDGLSAAVVGIAGWYALGGIPVIAVLGVVPAGALEADRRASATSEPVSAARGD